VFWHRRDRRANGYHLVYPIPGKRATG
jgi:hypothetical protein